MEREERAGGDEFMTVLMCPTRGEERAILTVFAGIPAPSKEKAR
jgi:hypothetical protein